MGNVAWRGSVPVSVLTPRPTTVIRPLCECTDPSARTSSSSGLASLRLPASALGRPRVGQVVGLGDGEIESHGSSEDTTVSTVGCGLPTYDPTSTWRLPARPVMGLVTVV